MWEAASAEVQQSQSTRPVRGATRKWVKGHPYLVREPGRERAAELGMQPRALGSTIGAEQPLVPRQDGAKNAFTVNRKRVNSNGYRERIESLPITKKAADGVRREAGCILADCDGTQRERMSAVEWGTGRTVADSFGAAARDGRTAFTASQALDCMNAKGGVVLVHNHPASGRPSFADIRAVAQNPFVKGSIVAGHDGTLFFIGADDDRVVDAYNRIREAVKKNMPLLPGVEVDAMALDVLYDRNREGKWFTIKKT